MPQCILDKAGQFSLGNFSHIPGQFIPPKHIHFFKLLPCLSFIFIQATITQEGLSQRLSHSNFYKSFLCLVRCLHSSLKLAHLGSEHFASADNLDFGGGKIFEPHFGETHFGSAQNRFGGGAGFITRTTAGDGTHRSQFVAVQIRRAHFKRARSSFSFCTSG